MLQNSRINNNILLLLICFNWPQSESIINRQPAQRHTDNFNGNIYLNKQRPLWILQDQVAAQDYKQFVFSTHKPYYPQQQRQQQQQQQQQQMQQPTPQLQAHNYPQKRPATQHARALQKLPRHLQLPHQYWRMQQPRPTAQRHQQMRYINSKRQHIIPIRREQHYMDERMPTFDSMPGEDSAHPAAIFIYNGPKGELILNTMLSTRKYPMQEPVPGQVLYPPSVPIFRPKPIVERFRGPMGRSDVDTQPLNLTLIPFYAHEAINAPRMLNYGTDATTARPAVLYAATVTATPSKKRRPKKAKNYAAYRSPNEVQWRPPKVHTLHTTPFPLTLASPLQNHRQVESEVEHTTRLPSYALDYAEHSGQVESSAAVAAEADADADGVEQQVAGNAERFQIIYVEESLEKPTTPTKTPLLSSRYAVAKEYYAFPVFTLGKLLKTETEKESHAFMMENTVNNALEEPYGSTKEQMDKDNVDTWFILNSRYKGHHNHNDEYRLSSKYVQTNIPETTASAL